MTATEQTTVTASKPAVIAALRAFIAQRSGLDWRDYAGDRASLMSDHRPILKHGRHARQLLRAVELTDTITAEDLIEASKRAFSGRLTLKVRDDGAVAVEYCTGQYFPTEYRNAACAVLASALWYYWRAHCMPAPKVDASGIDTYGGLSAGDWLRRYARREFGRSIAAAWFS